MSIGLVVTAGFGNGTLAGTIPFVTTRGYSIGEEILPEIADTNRILVPVVQARNILLATIDRKMIPLVTARNIKPKVR